METLADAMAQLKGRLTEEETRELKKRLYLIWQLSSLQLNLSREIERTLDGKGLYRYSVKNFHKRIHALIWNNTNAGFWKGMPQEQLDMMAEDADEIEGMMYRWAGITPYDGLKMER